jgi:hypothetical protein
MALQLPAASLCRLGIWAVTSSRPEIQKMDQVGKQAIPHDRDFLAPVHVPFSQRRQAAEVTAQYGTAAI